MPPRHACLALLAAALAGSAAAQEADDPLREAFRDAAARSDLGNAFQALAVFGATPGIASANFDVDAERGERFKLSGIKLSPSRTFAPVAAGVSPYAELTVGFLQADEVQIIAPFGTRAEVDYTVFNVLAGAGVEIALTEDLALRPILLAGYSHIRDDAEASGPFADELLAAGRGIVFDADLDSVLIGGALALVYEHRFEAADINGTASARYNLLYDTVVSASDPSLESDGTFSVITAGAEFDGPTGLSVFGREVRWIGFASGTVIPGDPGDALGFNGFAEFGGGVELVDREVVSFVEGVSLRASGIVGDGVTGWTVGAGFEF